MSNSFDKLKAKAATALKAHPTAPRVTATSDSIIVGINKLQADESTFTYEGFIGFQAYDIETDKLSVTLQRVVA
jgi:hypothetical protein